MTVSGPRPIFRNKHSPDGGVEVNFELAEMACDVCDTPWQKVVSDPPVYRASGEVICEQCGKKYYDHPLDQKILSYDGKPFIHVLCNGDRLKL